jgi:hypothetical protein
MHVHARWGECVICACLIRFEDPVYTVLEGTHASNAGRDEHDGGNGLGGHF